MGDKDNDDDLDSVKNVWIILNIVLVVYALILFIYGKFFKHKDSLSLVIHSYLILLIINIEKYYWR